MKKTVKLGVIFLILGLILAIFGIANNGIQSVYWDKGFHVMQQYHKTYHPNKLKSLTLGADADVVVVRGNTASIKVITAGVRPTVTNTNGHITINSPRAPEMVGFMLSDNTNRIEITVPNKTTLTRIKTTSARTDLQLRNLNVQQLQLTRTGHASLDQVTTTKPLVLSADDVQLNQVTAPQLKLSTSAANVNVAHSQFAKGPSTIDTSDGNITLSHSTFKQARLKTTTGNLNVHHNQFKQAKIATTDGNITLDNNQLTKLLTATTNDGNLHVQTNRQTGIQASTSDGTLNIFNQKHSGDDRQKMTYRPNATVQYQLKTDDGNITVSAS